MGQEILNGKPQACPPATSAPWTSHCFWSAFPTVASRSGCHFLFSGCCSSVAKSCLSTNPLTAAHQAPLSSRLPELAQTRVHRIDDAIQPSHPLPPPSLPTFSLSQHQGLFQWVSSVLVLTVLIRLLFCFLSFFFLWLWYFLEVLRALIHVSGVLSSFTEYRAGCNFFCEERDGKELLLHELPGVSYLLSVIF